MRRCDFCCCQHQSYLQIFYSKGIPRRLLNIHSIPATWSTGKRWKDMSLLDEECKSQTHASATQQRSAMAPLSVPTSPRFGWGFLWPWIESIGFHWGSGYSSDWYNKHVRPRRVCTLFFFHNIQYNQVVRSSWRMFLEETLQVQCHTSLRHHTRYYKLHVLWRTPS